MSDQKLREAWQEPVHADFFDARARHSLEKLRYKYEKFNEFRLFLEHKEEIQGRDFVEIACATGELYRYLHAYHTEFNYYGFDISKPAIERARQKYPDVRFDVCQPDLSNVIADNINPAVVWARDVVHHQPDPFKYLTRLLTISKEVTILRIRTRDKGATVLDPDVSCQWHYNHWVPYIVLNVDEAVEAICKVVPIKKMFVVKNYVQLGGRQNRFLPKECYYPETGTSETALYIMRAESMRGKPEVTVYSREEVFNEKRHHKRVYPLWLRAIGYLHRRLW